MADEEIKQLQNKRKKLISQQKQEERKKRDRRLYEKGAVFESIFTESKGFTKDEFYQLITFPNIKELVNQKILKIIEKREIDAFMKKEQSLKVSFPQAKTLPKTNFINSLHFRISKKQSIKKSRKSWQCEKKVEIKI